MNGGPLTLASDRYTVGGTNYILGLTSTATSVSLDAFTENTLYFTGLGGNTFGATNGPSTNWSVNSSGTPDAGTQPNLATDVYFTASNVTSPVNLTLGANVSINSVNFTAASPTVTIGADGNTLTLNGATGISAAGGSPAQTINANVALGTNQTWSNASSNLLTIGGPVANSGFNLTLAGSGNIALGGVISGTGGLTTAGTGVVSASAVETYTGSTILSTGTLAFTADQTLPNLFFGLAPSSPTSATSVATTSAALDLTNANATIAATLVVQTNSVIPNTITIGSGKTLTLPNGITAGLNVATALGATNSELTISGPGALAITGGSFQAGVSQSTVNAANSSMGVIDLSKLAGGFTANVTNFYVGVGNDDGGIVTLSNTSNAITATLLSVGNSTGNNAGPSQILTLGAGTNTIAADTIDIALSKSLGTIGFASAATDSGGTVTITNAAGTGDAAIDLGDRNGTGGTTSTPVGTLDLFGHNATVHAGAVTLGTDASDATTSTIGGVIDFDTGVFNVDTSLTLAALSVSSGATKATGTVTINGGTFNINDATVLVGYKTGSGTGSATAVINVSGGTLAINAGSTFTIASFPSGGGSAVGTLNITGSGVVNSAVAINGGGGTSTITLYGGTLNMQGNTIGGSAPISTLNWYGGTLENVSGINSGAGLNVSSKTNLFLAGANTYPGPTTVTAGELTVTGAGATAISATSGLTVAAGAAFNYAPASSPDTLQIGSAGTLSLGAGSTIGLAFGNSINAPGSVSAPSGNVYLNMSGAFSSGTQYTLLTTGSSGDFTNGGAATYLLANPTNYTASITSTATSVSITPTVATPLTAAYWLGNFTANPGVWASSDGAANSNWVTSSTGGATPLVPGSGANVTFSATGAANEAAMSLGADMAVNGITVSDTAAITLANTGGFSLTIGGGGITANSGSGTISLAPNIALSAAQAWTNNGSNTLTVSGPINNQGNLLTLAGHTTVAATTLIAISGVISGTGGLTVTADAATNTGISKTVNITGLNTYTGPTTLTATVASRFVYAEFNSIGNVNGGASALGNPDTVADGTITLNAVTGDRTTLYYTGGSSSSDRVIDITGAGSLQLWDNSGTTLTLTGGVVNTSGTAAGFAMRGGGAYVESGVIAIGNVVLSTTDGSSVHLTNTANTFTGDLDDHFGTMYATSIADIGVPSSIGEGSSNATSIDLAQSGSTGTLVVSSPVGGETNHPIQIDNSGNSTATIAGLQNSIAGTLVTFSGAITITNNTTADAAKLTLGGAGNGALSGGIGSDNNASKLIVTMSGTGTWAFNGTDNYGGGTTVSTGTLLANSTNATYGSTGSGLVTVAASAKLGGGTAAGAGQILGGVTVAAKGIISAGDAAVTPGKLNIAGTTTLVEGTGTVAAADSSVYLWKMADASGGSAMAGVHWDELTLSTLSLTAGGNNLVTVEPLSVGGAVVGGAAANFNPASNYTWPIALVSSGGLAPAGGGVAANFQLDAPALSAFASANGVSPSSFALDVSNSGAELDLVYTSTAPEPTSLAMLALGLGGLLSRRRRKSGQTYPSA